MFFPGTSGVRPRTAVNFYVAAARHDAPSDHRQGFVRVAVYIFYKGLSLFSVSYWSCSYKETLSTSFPLSTEDDSALLCDINRIYYTFYRLRAHTRTHIKIASLLNVMPVLFLYNAFITLSFKTKKCLIYHSNWTESETENCFAEIITNMKNKTTEKTGEKVNLSTVKITTDSTFSPYY